MADLTDIQAAGVTKIVGADAVGVEQTPVQSTSQGGLHSNLRDAAGAETGVTANPVRTDPTGTTTQPVSAASLPLPTGAATAANQATEIASLASIDAGIPAALGAAVTASSMPVNIASDQVVPVSATTLPLPTGAATSANQTTEITSLQLIDDVPAAMNAAFSKGAPAMGQLDDTSTTAATEDNVAPVRITPQRAIHTNLRNQAGTEVGTAAAPVRTDPTGTTTQPVSYVDVAPATQNITAQDTSTSTFVGANSQNFYTGTPTAGSAASFALSSIRSVNIQASLLGGGGTMVVEVSTDGGVFWFRPSTFQIGTQNYANSFGSPFAVLVNVAGMTNVRVRAISVWTGTATIAVKESANDHVVSVTDSALPVGAATSALQTTGNASLVSIDAGIPAALGAAVIASSMPVNIASDQTVPISAAALPLPTGAATAANQATEITSLQLIDDIPHAQNAALSKGVPLMGQLDDTSTTAATEDAVAVARITAQRALHTNLRSAVGVELLGQKPMATSIPVAIASDQSPIPVSIASAAGTADIYSSFSPDPGSFDTGVTGPPLQDAAGNAMIRGQVLSDEGSLRDDFPGSSLTNTLTGTPSFTNSGLTVTGTSTLFTSELKIGQYIKKTADAVTLFVQIASIESDISLTLETSYQGTTAAAASISSNWTTSGTTGTASVASSVLSLAPSTASGNIARVLHQSDYLPFNLLFKANISQRIANQTSVIGMQDNPTTPTKQAVIVFDGTTSTTLKFRTASSSAAADIQETVVTLPSSGVTSAYHTYEIDLTGNQAALTIDGIVSAIHSDHIPGPYDVLAMVASVTNAAVVTATTLNIDYFYFSNLDQIEVTNDFKGEPMKAQLMGKSSVTGLPLDLNLDSNGNLIVTALTGFNANFSFGDTTTAAATTVPVRRTTYTEQVSNAQRSIISASASDAAAGTGARTVTITYLDSTCAGPFTEVVTLNGITAVNTVATNICFIEKIQVTTVGSNASNVGIISLKAATAGGGATIWTIAAADNQTFGAHHYIPTGKTCNITGVSSGHNGTTVGSGALFVLKSLPIGVANAVEVQVTDFIRLYGQSSTFSRAYTSPVKVTGPARLISYVSPETTSSTIYRSAFDYFEP